MDSEDGLLFNFIIPQKLEDLCTYNKDRYTVSTDFNANEVEERIPELNKALTESGPSFILHNFDVLYGVVKHFNTVSQSTRQEAWKTVYRTVLLYKRQLEDEMNESSQNSDLEEGISDRKSKCNILKMLMYIFCNLIQLFEERDKKKTEAIEAVATKGMRGKKAAPAKKSDESLDWETNREKALITLRDIVFLPLHKLFASETVAKEDVINLAMRVCYSIITNPGIKGRESVKTHANDIITNAVCRHNQSFSFCIKVIELLQVKQKECSYLKDLISIVEKLVIEQDRSIIAADLIQELNRLDFSKETSVKIIADFLKELGDRIPRAFIPCITTLLDDFLDVDAYMIRSASLSIIGSVVSNVLSHDNLSDRDRKLRDALLDKLEEHLMDTASYTRGRAIQVWTRLCSEEKIPLKRLENLISKIVQRIRDKNGYVRKAAIIFLTEFLAMNPFGAKLSLALLREELSKQKCKLNAMLQERGEGGEEVVQDNQEIEWEEKWKTLQEPFVVYWSGSSSQEVDDGEDFDEGKEEDPESNAQDKIADEDLSPDSYNEIKDTVNVVRSLIQKKKFSQTVEFIKGLKKKFADDPVFATLDEDDSESSEEDEVEEPIPGTMDTSASKSSLPASILFAKRIFLLGVKEAKKEENIDSVRKMEEVAEKLRGKKRKRADQEDDQKVTEAVEQEEDTQEQEDEVVINDLTGQQRLVKYLEDCVCFAEQVQAAIPDICSMLWSKTISDSQAAIDFFVTAHEFGVEGSLIGIRKFINLIFSKDKGVVDSVIDAFKRIYLTSPSMESMSDAQRKISVVKNLMVLVEGASVGELVSLETLLCHLMASNEITADHLSLLFQKYKMKNSTSLDEAKISCQLIGMIASYDKNIIRNSNNFNTLVDVGLVDRCQDSQFVQETLKTLQKTVVKNPKIEEKLPSFRLEKKHKLFTQLHTLLVQGFRSHEDQDDDAISNFDDRYFIPMSTEAIRTIYSLSEQPDERMEDILHDIFKKMNPRGVKDDSIDSLKENEDTNTIPLTQPLTQTSDGDETLTEITVDEITEIATEKLSRFISILGDIVLYHTVYIETQVLTEVKIRKYIRECREAAKKGKEKPVAPTTSKKRMGTPSTVTTTPGTNLEEEIGLAGASAVEDDLEQFRVYRIIDDNNNLIAKLTPLITHIVQHPVDFPDQNLYKICVTSLGKFMLCSQSFCSKHLRVLFTVLETSENGVIRQNAIVCLGDLCVRYPNLLDPWTSHLYSSLNDTDVGVRSNSLKVLSRLILSDQLKVKGQISELAKILVDDDENLAGMAKSFFEAYKKKDNAIYNVLPDIISNLSGGERQQLDENRFKHVMEFLLPMVESQRQIVSLVEKICQRFRVTHDERQWRDLTFCLTKMKFEEPAVKVLNENMICFADKLTCDEVYEGFQAILEDLQKLNTPVTVKDLVESFKQKILECREKGIAKEDESEIQKVVGTPPSSAKKSSGRMSSGKMSTVKKVIPKTSKTSTKKNTRTRGRTRGKQKDSDEEEEEEGQSSPPKPATSKRNTRRAVGSIEEESVAGPSQSNNDRPVRTRRMIRQIFADDSNESSE